jgi:hypothetical protein
MFICGSGQLLWSVMNLCSTSVGSILFGTSKFEIVGNSNDDFFIYDAGLILRLWATAMMIFYIYDAAFILRLWAIAMMIGYCYTKLRL